MSLGSNKQRALISIVCCSLLLNLSCKNTVESFSDLLALRTELIREYQAQDVGVVIQNSHVLGINLINSPINNLSELERENKAQEIALFAKNHYRSINGIDTIWVSFVISNVIIFFNYSSGIGTYVFEAKSLGHESRSSSDEAQGALASYNQETNQTTIYLKKSLQLNSEAGSTVMLFPHFAVPATGVTAPKLPIPGSVVLDFTTSSGKRMFSDSPPLVIRVDGQTVFSGKAKVTNVMGSDVEKSFNEFLTQEISYGQFLQITNGREVTLGLGPKEFKLTPEQLRALQDMRKCVEEANCW